MHAIVLSIGDELVLGQSLDTNSRTLSAALAAIGIGTLCHQTVADDLPTIRDAIAAACEHASVVLVTGGLGPTPDDLTRQALAEAMGVELVLDEQAATDIKAFFESRGREMPARNLIQAEHPQGSRTIANSRGTAPGIDATLGDARLFLMPGPPSEMIAMFEGYVLPEVHKLLDVKTMGAGRPVILTESFHTFGAGESSIAERLGDLLARDRNPMIGTTVSQSIVTVRIRAESNDLDKARKDIKQSAAAVKKCLGPLIFGKGDITLQGAVGKLLKKEKLSIATAESCTGGLLSKMLTDSAGASAFFKGGWITYANQMKINQLGVNPITLDQYGAVSEPVAVAMATGALERSGADYALALTGIAGPGGGSKSKPVGTVWIALGVAKEKPIARRFQFSGDRETIRDRAAKTALQLLRYKILNEPLEDLPIVTPIEVATKN